jgi:DNA-binding response OmpR family regulator
MVLDGISTEVEQKQDTLRVLIADDDHPTRILLRAAINQWGYEVIEAGDGEEAWEILQTVDAPRLLIVDWLMPRLDGVALCSRIKHELTYHPYTILLTQVSGTENIIKGLEAGADEFLAKPFNMAELRSRLSVGARIIQYENVLRNQNKELEQYIGQMETLGALALSISREIYYFLKHDDSSRNDDEREAHLKRLQELQESLGHIIDFIKNLQLDTKIRR